MIAIQIAEPGNAEVLTTVERPVPVPAAHQVLIKVTAAGVNRPDILQRQGLYPAPAGASDIPGLEVAGEIVATGAAVDTFKNGDKVCALVAGGGYAEYCLASASICLPIPAPLDDIESAALPETLFTVWSNVFDRGRLRAGESILVHGGSSGIGSIAIQLGRAFGASVYVTAGTDDKCKFCLALGAAAAINYRQQDYVEAIRSLTNGEGVNVILDMVAGDYFPRNIKCLSEEGRLLQIAIQQGAKSEINLWTVMQKRLTVTGSTLRARDDTVKSAIAHQCQRQVWPLIASGDIKPVIHATFPLTQAASAHRLMESSEHMGKIILKV